MEINGSVDNNGSTNDDTLEDDEYEPIISTPSSQSNGKKLGVSASVYQHKIKALKWISYVLAAAVLLYSVKDIMFGVRMNREETEAVQDLEGEVVPSIKQQKIANYVKGTAIIRNIHITHHAGTSLCGQMGKVPNEHTPGLLAWGKEGTMILIGPRRHSKQVNTAIGTKLCIKRTGSGKCGGFQTKIPDDPSNETQDLYWEYANSGCADNYALRVLTRE
eukprot:scaffold44694_cov248-Skeletonema_marinoi.AAC.3